MDPVEKLKWKADWSVGNHKLDLQHKTLIGLINELTTEEASNNPKEYAKVLTLLTIFFKIHFSAEEAYMEKQGYPFFEKHKAEHRQFMLQLSMFNLEFSHQEPTRAEEVYHFGAAWLFEHSSIVDLRYKDFIEQKRSSAKKTTSGNSGPAYGAVGGLSRIGAGVISTEERTLLHRKTHESMNKNSSNQDHSFP